MRTALILTGLMLAASGIQAHDNDHKHEHTKDHTHDHGHSHDHHKDEPGAHVHGQATMQLAMEGTEVDLFFTTPTVNLLGFEHRPETEAQHTALDKAVNYFRQMALLHPAGGECRVITATVESPLLDEDFQGSHSDLEVSQTLECSPALPGKRVQVAVLVDWTGIDKLQLQWLGDNGQGSQALTQRQQHFRP